MMNSTAKIALLIKLKGNKHGSQIRSVDDVAGADIG
jgi:hypothetical protein